MKIFVCVIIFFLFSCKEIRKQHVVKIQRSDTMIIGNIIDDSLYNDTIKYYTLDKILIRTEVYKNGKLEGISTNFYPNGKPRQISSFTGGVKNGYSSYFDSSGHLIYRDFAYFDLTVGQ